MLTNHAVPTPPFAGVYFADPPCNQKIYNSILSAQTGDHTLVRGAIPVV